MAEYATNPKAGFDYEILETIEAGLVLEGYEVKAIKTGKVSIKGSYVKVLNNEPYLIGATVSPYQPANTPKDYDPQRSRKLLLSKKEISTLVGTSQTHGLTLVPLKIYNEEAFLVGATISPYQPANTSKSYDPQRSRKLLLSKKEISKFVGLSQSQGLTLIPLKFYDRKSKIKLLVGVAKGKKKYDKREPIKKKDIQRLKQRGIEQ